MLDLGQFANFHFIRPWWLLALLGLALTSRYFAQERDPVARWSTIVAPHLVVAMLVRGGHKHWFNPVLLANLALVLGALILAGPTWKQQPSPFVEDKAVLVIALDLSRSMTQRDVQPSRLERSRQKIEDLLRLRKGARTGLIVFAGSAHSVIPLTNDPDIIRHYLSAVTPEMMPRPGKFPEKALPVADAMLRDSQVPGTILLIADGIGPNTAVAFSAYFEEQEHQLLVLGVGETEQAEADGTTQPLGGSFIALQRDALKTLASDNRGRYQELTLDDGDVKRINRQVNSHLRNVEDGSRPWVDAGYYLLFPLALVFLFWFRRGWTLHWGLALFIAVSGSSWSPTASAGDFRFADAWLTPDQQGRFYFDKGDYETAAERFDNTAWKAAAFYASGQFEAAAELFSRIDTADGLFSLGNALAQSQNYLYAVRRYNQVLDRQPDHAGALNNREVVQKIIDEINRLSESQRPEGGSKEMEDGPRKADGAEKQIDNLEPQEIKQLSADEIMADQAIRDMWLRQIQQDPSRFLSIKFYMQLDQENSGASE